MDIGHPTADSPIYVCKYVGTYLQRVQEVSTHLFT